MEGMSKAGIVCKMALKDKDASKITHYINKELPNIYHSIVLQQEHVGVYAVPHCPLVQGNSMVSTYAEKLRQFFNLHEGTAEDHLSKSDEQLAKRPHIAIVNTEDKELYPLWREC
eukprot:9091887-Ditylum_brightwellii.AAC.1